MPKVYQAIVRAIADQVEGPLFALMGDGNLDLMVEFAERHGRTLVHARHEQNAVAMADGYARFSGGIGLCSVTQGPGLTNTATSLTVARHHRSPVLLLAGQSSLGQIHHIQRFDQIGFVRATAGAGLVVESAAMVKPALDAAFRHLRAGRGPFVLNLPYDVQQAMLPDDWTYVPPPLPAANQPEASALAQAADWLAAAKRPAILAGHGAVQANADDAVAQLATHLGAPIATSLLAKGFCSDHPLSVGVAGGLGEGRAEDVLRQCDVILALGTSLNQWTTTFGELGRDARFIQVDHEAEAFGDFMPVALALEGDVGASAAELLRGVRERMPARNDGVIEIATGTPRAINYDDGGAATVDPRRAVDVVEAALPGDRVILVDGGHTAQAVCQRLSIRDPRDFGYSFDFACIGQGLALAIGACFARPGRRVTLLTGDGSLMMNLGDLDTAARYDLPLTVIVLTDDGFGQERHTLRRKGLPVIHADQKAPAFAPLADAVGGKGRRFAGAGSLGGLGVWLKAAGPYDGLMMADIAVNGAFELPSSAEIARRMH